MFSEGALVRDHRISVGKGASMLNTCFNARSILTWMKTKTLELLLSNAITRTIVRLLPSQLCAFQKKVMLSHPISNLKKKTERRGITLCYALQQQLI